ncbi:hypothetical protein BGZ63DRAFT_121476 [Mariannaea sp. PMI_226]|nr:hypothetical protein BGZ63DRAFT_121476 [Mariannaea sp. PMI_226]
MMASNTWDGQDQTMAASGEDDFGQFLDMTGMGNLSDGMHFDFHGFQDGSAQGMMNQPRDTADTIMTNSDGQGLVSNANIPISTSTSQASIPAHMMTPSMDPISTIDAQIQYLQQQKFEQQQRQIQEQQVAFFSTRNNHSVPPTPQSLEMPNSGQFYSQAEQISQSGVYDGGYHQRLKEQQDMAFTPLVSPAVTPLDPHFNIDSSTFTVPGAYFSPLTSPALHAQNDVSIMYDHNHSNNSPVEMELETSNATNSVLDQSKKPRKKPIPKPRGKANVRSSPIVKAQRRKTGPSPAIVSQVLTEVEENGSAAFLPLPANSTETSPEENSSVSPETLSDMPPPPVPTRRSTSKSPYIPPQRSGQQTPVSLPADSQPAPATPASLMKLPASKAAKSLHNSLDTVVPDHIESLELPEAVSNKVLGLSVPRLLSQSTLEPAPPKGNGFQPLQSPIFPKPSGPASATQSPKLAPGSSGPAARRTPQLAPRSSRGRTGSVQMSPALLPKISPNIKPLLPGTPGMTAVEDAASRLLMSKSNYQNILEGNQVPGVSYPSELSTNLTSKRTSHKIAEQGRRNRINSALQVMAGLLPNCDNPKSDDSEGNDKKDKKESKQANAQNSKASVVENAIVHMKNLQQENGNLKQELAELRKQLEELKATEMKA